jgi:aspartate/methionine/tyrosine aminotransferase
VQAQGGVTIVDEIYLGLSFDDRYGGSALAFGDHIVSVNSFSKYFGMTGWRLGWLVLPPELVGPVEKLAQNLFICPSAVAQHAALACFEPASLSEYERRRAELHERRDFIVQGLRDLGLAVPVVPDGAFYAWIDVSSVGKNSWDYAFELMEKAQIALTPGRDFGHEDPGRWLRLSFAGPMSDLREAVSRWRACL